MRLTFKNKALYFMISVLIIVSTVYTYEAINTEKSIMRTEIIKRAEVITTLATKTGELPILSGNPELLKNAAAFLKSTPEVVFVSFYDSKMKELIHDGITVPEPPGSVASGSSVIFFETQDLFDFYAPVFTLRPKEDIDIFQGAENIPQIKDNIGWVRIGFSKADMRRAENRIVFKGVMLAIIFATLSGIIVSILIAIATKPLMLLFSAVKKIEKGEYPEIKGITSSDEIGELAVAFDRMSAAIKDRELRLMRSEKRIRDLFDRVEHAIFRLDKDGNIVETNKNFDEICGGIDKFCSLFVYGRDTSCLQRAASQSIKNVEMRITGSNGNEHTVIMSIYPEFDEGGEIAGYDGYFVNITEKKKFEEVVMQSQKLESLGLLAGGIAHDFNNILTGVLGYSTLLKTVVPENEKIYKYIDTIEKSAKRATNLTQQLLGFARKGKYSIEKFNIDYTLNEMVCFLRETFDRSITIVLDSEENLPPVEGDSNQIYQALMNLCLNARDAMPGGGRLYIKAEFYLLHDRKVYDLFQIPPGEYMRISVTDTGRGMSPDVKKRIFEPFYTTKDVGKGTGLGLAMVYGIVKNHGGYINVYSEPDLGTCMRIYLPKAEGSVEDKRGEKSMGTRPAKGTILIIDDEEVMRELSKDILEAYNFEVLLAIHGNEGIRIFNEHKDRIDLVILDMVMPVKGGRQTFKEIKVIKPDVKVILCSGYAEEKYFYELLEASNTGFLQKPFQSTELLSKVEDALMGNL
ncbi:MAG: response regulator [Nitrospirae bacterium]|nr:response regulator [Nitrospirota bacterium]MCL5236263.1 response regulator [Nitrospirota bacterium]